ELLDQLGGVAGWRIGIEEVVWPGEHVVDAGPSRLDHQCGADAVARADAGEREGLLDVIRIALPDGESTRLVRRIRQQPRQLLHRQTRRASRGSGRPPDAGDGVTALVASDLEIRDAKTHG